MPKGAALSGVLLVGQDVTFNGAINKPNRGKLVDQGGCYFANQDTWVILLDNPANNPDILLWLAALGTSPTYFPPYTFGSWSDWFMLQYSSTVIIGGVATNVNLPK